MRQPSTLIVSLAILYELFRQSDDQAGDRAIEEASRVAYRYFSRLGAGGDYGRSIER